MATRGVVAALVTLFVLTAGCLGLITGSEPAVFEADPVSVGDEALAATEFEPREDRAEWINRTVEVAGQEREVRVRNHVATYERPADVTGASDVTFGVFVVVSTPEASIAGQALNPIGRMDHRELVERVAGAGGNVEDVSRAGSRTLTVLGSETDVTRFSATAQRSGVSVPVYIEVTRVRHEGDFVVALGIYPQESVDMRSQVTTLFGGVEH